MSHMINLFSILGYTIFDAVKTPLNSHHGYQMFYVLTGRIAYMISGKEYVLKEGECIIVPPFAEHGVVSSFGSEPAILDVQFTVKDTADDKNVRKICGMVHSESSSTRPLVKIVISEARKRHGLFYYIAQDVIETMLLILVDKNQSVNVSNNEGKRLKFEDCSECTKRAIRYIEGHIAGNYEFDLERVAKILGYNKRYLCKTFIGDVGMSIKQYFMMLRIEKAKELIDHTDYMLKDIAAMLGFTSYVHFERMFKLHSGMTPISYRNQPKTRTQYYKYSFWDAFENE